MLTVKKGKRFKLITYMVLGSEIERALHFAFRTQKPAEVANRHYELNANHL
jgi:hypothetical protein